MSAPATPPTGHRFAIAAWMPTLLNALACVYVLKAAWLQWFGRKAVDLFARLQAVPRVARPRRVWAELHGWPRGCLPDPNAPLKGLLDVLVNVGLLAGDGPRWCELASAYYVRSAERSTVVSLENLPDAEAACSE
jgi:hypothetical protein